MLLCYKCHKQKDASSFRFTADDPLAQVCDDCKNTNDDEKEEALVRQD